MDFIRLIKAIGTVAGLIVFVSIFAYLLIERPGILIGLIVGLGIFAAIKEVYSWLEPTPKKPPKDSSDSWKW
jgi:hypothetical protein